MRKLALRLPRSSPVRQIVFTLLDYGSEELLPLQPLVDVLKNPSETRWCEQAVAAWVLGRVSLGEVQKEEAARLLCYVASNQQMRAGKRLLKRSGRAFLRTALVSLVPVSMYLLFRFLRQEEEPGTSLPDLDLILMLLYVLVFVVLSGLSLVFPFYSLLMDYERNMTARKFALRSLGNLRQPLSIGTLADASTKSDPEVSGEAAQALRRVLIALTPRHHPEYSGATPNLCRLLGTVDESLLFQVLEALEKIGDGRAAGPVERLTKQRSSMKVCEEAKRILPLLQERQRRENDPRRLVRPAHSPADDETLLRPAAGSRMSEPETLLRSALFCETLREADREE